MKRANHAYGAVGDHRAKKSTLWGSNLIVIGVIAVTCGCVPDVAPKKNENPKQEYRVDVVIHDDGEPIDNLSATVSYAVASSECLPTDQTRALGGVKVRGHYGTTLDVGSFDNESYSFQIVDDYFRREKLYPWKSECEWAMESASVVATKGGKKRAAAFGREMLEEDGAAMFICSFNEERAFDACKEAKTDSAEGALIMIIKRK